MARIDSQRKSKKACSDTPSPELLAHIRAIGMTSVADYVAWCGQHGFSRRLNKNWRQRVKEKSLAHRAISDARLARKKSEVRSPLRTIDDILAGRVDENEVTQAHLKEICRACKSAGACPKILEAIRELLIHIGESADLFDAAPVIPQYGRQNGNSCIGGVLALAWHADKWIRPVKEWKPTSHNSRRQFASLARHLLARWPVPAFMDSVFFKSVSPEALRQQQWFIHIGQGENIRMANLPLPYTKRMAHHFMQAPADYSVEPALRWGQIQALGGDARLVRTIVGTRLGTHFEHDDFWITVLQFFIANPMLDQAQIGPIVDFLHQQRFVSQDTFVAPGVIERKQPPQPELSMKGRTPESLLRQMEAWHRTLAKTEQPQAEWKRSGIEAFEWLEGSEKGGNIRIGTIRELLSTKSLVAEGRAMRHCVATYARSCAFGDCSIWTMEVETFEGRSKLLTIEVQNQAKLICQIRGKCNATPAEQHRQVIRRWAEQGGLQLSRYV